MNNCKYFFILIAFSFFTNCTSVSKNSDELIYVSLEDITQKESTETLSSVASEIIYVPLETNDNSLLDNSLNVFYMDNYFIVRDNKRNIHMFDKEGKHIKRVTQEGGGPSEFSGFLPPNIIVDPATNHFYLISDKKVIKFDENANYTDHFQMDYERGFFSNYPGVFTHRKTMILSLFNTIKSYDDTTTVFNAIEVDTLGRVINKYINHSPRYTNAASRDFIMLNEAVFFDKIDNNIRFQDYGNDTIFSVSGGTMIPYAILYLGKNKMDLTLESVKERASASGYILQKVIENGKYFFIKLNDHGKLIFCIYDKEAKKTEYIKEGALSNDLDGGISFMPEKSFNNGDLICWKNAEEFKEEILSKDYDTQKAKYGERFEKVYQLAKSLKDDDNMVLIIVK